MIKQYIRASIIVLIQTILLIITLLAITPLVINDNNISYWQDAFSQSQPWCLGLHGLVYLGLMRGWTRLVSRISIQNQLSPDKTQLLIKTRWYFLAIFLCIDVLMVLK